MWPSLSRAKREEMSKTTEEVHRCSEERHVDGLCRTSLHPYKLVLPETCFLFCCCCFFRVLPMPVPSLDKEDACIRITILDNWIMICNQN